MLTIPLLAGAVWAYLQPADHAVKVVLRGLLRAESQAFASLTGCEIWPDEARAVRALRRLFWAVAATLAAASALSVGAFLGWLPTG